VAIKLGWWASESAGPGTRTGTRGLMNERDAPPMMANAMAYKTTKDRQINPSPTECTV
jgi:hypothetical protein